MIYKGEYKDGKKDGLQLYFYENGNLQYECNYKNGKKEGRSVQFNKNFSLISEENYKDDKLDGSQSYKYANKNKHYKYNFKNGIQDGIQREYDKDGYIIKEEEYKDGKKVERNIEENKYEKKDKVFNTINKLIESDVTVLGYWRKDSSYEPYIREIAEGKIYKGFETEIIEYLSKKDDAWSICITGLCYKDTDSNMFLRHMYSSAKKGNVHAMITELDHIICSYEHEMMKLWEEYGYFYIADILVLEMCGKTKPGPQSKEYIADECRKTLNLFMKHAKKENLKKLLQAFIETEQCTYVEYLKFNCAIN
jgi:hypothetical protein